MNSLPAPSRPRTFADCARGAAGELGLFIVVGPAPASVRAPPWSSVCLSARARCSAGVGAGLAMRADVGLAAIGGAGAGGARRGSQCGGFSGEEPPLAELGRAELGLVAPPEELVVVPMVWETGGAPCRLIGELELMLSRRAVSSPEIRPIPLEPTTPETMFSFGPSFSEAAAASEDLLVILSQENVDPCSCLRGDPGDAPFRPPGLIDPIDSPLAYF